MEILFAWDLTANMEVLTAKSLFVLFAYKICEKCAHISFLLIINNAGEKDSKWKLYETAKILTIHFVSL